MLINLLTNDLNELSKAFDLSDQEKYIVASYLDKIKACRSLELSFLADHYEESLSEFLKAKE